ncbi:MAG: rod-binding protein [Rhodobacteraceae bacterium]|nr:rod-binding protein [Paracoccaceae bacterium]
MTAPIQPVSAQGSPSARAIDPLREVARDLEASFLAEMLKYSGLGKSRQSFGGGAGEDQFTSLLIDEQARAMVDAGGIGLAESIFQSLKEKAHE